MLPASREPYGGFLTPDDDEVVKILHPGICSSSSSRVHPNGTLVAYVHDRWHYSGAEYLIGQYGADLIWRVGSLLDELERAHRLPPIRNRAGYLRACLAEASQTLVQDTVPARLGPRFELLPGGKENAS